MPKNKKILLSAGMFLCFFLFAFPASAKDLFVSTTGNDSVTYANNDLSHPWLTPRQAFYNAQAGDTVYFRGGTYTVNSSFGDKYNGSNGTSGSPITFTAYSGETPTIALGSHEIIVDITITFLMA